MLVLHHSANPSTKHQAQQTIAQHLKEPKIKQAGAYHYFIEQDGTVVQFHPEDFLGHHAGSWAVNVRSIGICLAGDFSKHEATLAQLDAFTKLTTDIQTRWGIQDSNIKLHREVRLSPTACPCIDLRAIFLTRRKELLKTNLSHMQHALPRAKGTRKEALQRAIVRVMAALGLA